MDGAQLTRKQKLSRHKGNCTHLANKFQAAAVKQRKSGDSDIADILLEIASDLRGDAKVAHSLIENLSDGSTNRTHKGEAAQQTLF